MHLDPPTAAKKRVAARWGTSRLRFATPSAPHDPFMSSAASPCRKPGPRDTGSMPSVPLLRSPSGHRRCGSLRVVGHFYSSQLSSPYDSRTPAPVNQLPLFLPGPLGAVPSHARLGRARAAANSSIVVAPRRGAAGGGFVPPDAANGHERLQCCGSQPSDSLVPSSSVPADAPAVVASCGARQLPVRARRTATALAARRRREVASHHADGAPQGRHRHRPGRAGGILVCRGPPRRRRRQHRPAHRRPRRGRRGRSLCVLHGLGNG